jgi:hypothetical protein
MAPRDDTGGVVALRCVAAAIDALLLTLDAEPTSLRDRGRWQPLLPRATLALGEAVAHALPRASSAQQATAICALVRRACAKVAAFDRRLVRNVHTFCCRTRGTRGRTSVCSSCSTTFEVDETPAECH